MEKTIDQFIAETVGLYKLAMPSNQVIRSLKYKLAMADIVDRVKAEDTSLALDIVLGSLQKKPKGLLKTASIKNATIGTCPRCRGGLVSAKLVDDRAVGYCEPCRVAVAIQE